MKQRTFLAVAALALALVLDWGSKALAFELLPAEDLFRNDKQVNLLVLVPLLGIFGLLLYLVDNRVFALGCGLTLGGWLANCLDRAWRGPVLDFIPSPPPLGVVYNVADVMLVVGMAAMVLGITAWCRKDLASRPSEELRSFRSRLLLFFAAMAAVFVVDWTSKHLAPQLLGPEDVIYNSRGVFWPLLPIGILAAAYLIWMTTSLQLALALGALSGGAVANCLDRALRGPVLDFIPFGAGSKMLYFNLADAGIMIGVLIAAHAAVTIYRQRPKTAEA